MPFECQKTVLQQVRIPNFRLKKTKVNKNFMKNLQKKIMVRFYLIINIHVCKIIFYFTFIFLKLKIT